MSEIQIFKSSAHSHNLCYRYIIHRHQIFKCTNPCRCVHTHSHAHLCTQPQIYTGMLCPLFKKSVLWENSVLELSTYFCIVSQMNSLQIAQKTCFFSCLHFCQYLRPYSHPSCTPLCPGDVWHRWPGSVAHLSVSTETCGAAVRGRYVRISHGPLHGNGPSLSGGRQVSCGADKKS